MALQELFDKSRARQEGPGQVHSRSSSVSLEPAGKEARPLKAALGPGPRGCGSAAEPRCGRPGPGTCPACPRGCHRKALPLPAAVRAVTVGSEGYRGEKSSLLPGERKDDLFPCSVFLTGYFSREKARVNVVLGAFQHPRGLQKHTCNTPEPT